MVPWRLDAAAARWRLREVFKKSGPATLGEYLRQDYALYRDCKAETLRQYAVSVKLFESWATDGKGGVPLEQLDAASVSAWLRDYQATGVSPTTVRSKRNHVMILWMAASDDGYCDLPTRRVRPVRVPERAVTAWSREEVDQIVAACSRLKRPHPCGISRAEWWALAVRIAYDSGLRWEDQVRRLRLDMILPDGTIAFGQGKVGRVVVRRLSEGTMDALARSMHGRPRELATPWPYSHETFGDQFKRVVRIAGVRPGTWKWLRRTGATDVEMQQEGAATAHLGHRPGSTVARASYIDAAQVAAVRPPISPRPLRPPLAGT